jgi:chlorobactene glucosyltransferase
MYFYSLILIIVGVYFFIFSLLNILKIKKDTVNKVLTEQPLVSVLIPARNEENNIKKCLDSFLNQSYKNYEILVLDDNSTDKTYEIVKNLAKQHPDKIKLYSGKPLPPDWRGKSFAMQQLLDYANGEYYLFTDADTIHTEDSISLMMSNMAFHDADLVSGYIGQKTKTFGEKITIPLIYLLTGLVIPLWMNNRCKLSIFASAIGQYIGVKASAFKSIGGYEKIKSYTTEDIYLAREMKKAGFKTIFIDAKSAATCRMYTNYDQSVRGISKNIFDFLGKNSIVMFLIVIAIFFFLVIPAPICIVKLFEMRLQHSTYVDTFTFALIINFVLSFLSWLMIFATRKLPLYIAILYPLVHLNLLYIALVSWIRSEQGKGYVWKGRLVS